ncbi:MAG: glycosyltransferase [Burkholderiaceae bacterium]
MTSTSPLPRSSRPRTLLLYAHYNTRASYYDDWLDAFRIAPQFETSELNICDRNAAAFLRKQILDVDLLILLHSVNADHVFYLEPLTSILADRRCALVSFVGNEVNLPAAPISEKRRVLKTIRPDVIATQLLLEAGEYLWGDIASVLALPHALNSSAFAIRTAPETRKLDLGVRSFRYPAVLGDRDRNLVMDWVSGWGAAHQLTVEVSSRRLARGDWADYLDSCRGTVSTEAGSWYLQRDDSLMRQVVEHYGGETRRPVLSSKNVTLRKIAHRLPWRLRELLVSLVSRGPIKYEATALLHVSEQEILEKFFSKADRTPTYGKCVSSRHFDAIGTGTVQILLTGRYNDILVPSTHYLELARDFSNADELARQFLDQGERRRIAETALEHAKANHTYAHRVAALASRIGA